ESGRRLFARRRQFFGGLRESAVGVRRRLLQSGQLLVAGVDQRHLGRKTLGQCCEIVHGACVFAGGGAQGEQPLLDALQFQRIEIRRRQGGVEVLVGFLQRIDGGID